jgi:predicted nucleic acid-binding Zn ribbon protein
MVTPICPICAGPLPIGRARTYCSDRCRQAGHRRRTRQPGPRMLPPLAPGRSRRERTVYQCPECDQRYLGTQRCEDCNVWCRRIDIGGLCPACEEPVAMIDLLGAAIE